MKGRVSFHALVEWLAWLQLSLLVLELQKKRKEEREKKTKKKRNRGPFFCTLVAFPWLIVVVVFDLLLE